jgi:sec-independent protein translocase protein TatB
MNFMGIGPAEIIVILVVALVVVGPERLPRLAADIARTIRELRKYTSGITAEFTEVIHDFEKETEGERSQWKEIGEGLTSATRSVTDALRSARADADPTDAPQPAAPALPEPASGPSASGTWKDIPEPGLNAEPSTNGASAPAVDEPR